MTRLSHGAPVYCRPARQLEGSGRFLGDHCSRNVSPEAVAGLARRNGEGT